MPRAKIQDEQELIRWFDEGRTYRWMVEEYERKYNLQVGMSMFSNFRKRRGLARRIVRDDDLIPWSVKMEHRYAYPVMNLRHEARRRAGEPISPRMSAQVDGWLRNLNSDNLVVHYDPDTEQGWFYVPRRDGIDTDIIRAPKRKTTMRANADVEDTPSLGADTIH